MAEESGGALRELAAVFGISFDPEHNLQKGDKEVEGMIGTLKEAGKIFLEAFAVDKLKEFVMGQVEMALELERTSVELGVSTQKVQEYDLAAADAGVHAEDLRMGLMRLTRGIGEASKNGDAATATFGKFTIKLKEGGKARDTGDIFEELAEKIAAIPDAGARASAAFDAFGRQGARLLPLLAKGRAGFAEARKEMAELGGGTSKEFIESAKEVEASQVKLHFIWNVLSTQIASAFIPKVIKIIEVFTKTAKMALELNKNTHVLSTGLMFLSAFAVAKLITQLGELAEASGKTALGMLADFAIPIVVGGLLYLAFDEVYTLLNGGDTIIGRAAEKFLGFGAGVDVADDLSDAWRVFLNIMKELSNLLSTGFIGGIEGLWHKFTSSKALLPAGVNLSPEAEKERQALADRAQKEIDAAADAYKGLGDPKDIERGTGINRPSWRSMYKGGFQGPPMLGGGAGGAADVPLPGVAGAVQNMIVNQTMHFKNNPGDPAAVGKAAKSGVADAQQRGHYAASVAASKP